MIRRIPVVTTLLLLIAAVAAAQSVTVDFSNRTGTGTPRSFGVQTSMPSYNSSELALFNSLGVKMVRANVWPGNIVPVTTISAYRTALAAGCPSGSVCDPGIWTFNPEYNEIQTARNNGYPVVEVSITGNALVTDRRCMSWLTVGGSCEGEVADYTVWEDIITKMMQHFAPDVLDVMQEPNGAQYPLYNPTDYAVVFYHTAHALRQVNNTTVIAGPETDGGGDPRPYWDGIHSNSLAAPYMAANGAGTWHEYNGMALHSGDYCAYFHGYWPGVPCLVNEWDFDATLPNTIDDTNGPDTVGYVGSKLIWIYQNSMWANFFAGTCTGSIASDYFWQYPSCFALNNKDYSYALLSNDLGLGAGPGTLVATTNNAVTAAQGVINSAGNPVVALGNWAPPVNVSVTLNNLANGNYNLQTYLADSGSNHAQSPIENINVTVTNGTLTHTVAMTNYATAGILCVVGNRRAE